MNRDEIRSIPNGAFVLSKYRGIVRYNGWRAAWSRGGRGVTFVSVTTEQGTTFDVPGKDVLQVIEAHPKDGLAGYREGLRAWERAKQAQHRKALDERDEKARLCVEALAVFDVEARPLIGGRLSVDVDSLYDLLFPPEPEPEEGDGEGDEGESDGEGESEPGECNGDSPGEGESDGGQAADADGDADGPAQDIDPNGNPRTAEHQEVIPVDVPEVPRAGIKIVRKGE